MPKNAAALLSSLFGWSTNSPQRAVLLLRSLLRFLIGLMLLEYGSSKLFEFPVSLSHGEPLTPLIYASGVIETIAGSLLSLGLFTRIAAFVLSGEMAVVYFDYFLPRSPWPSINGGDLSISWCFTLLYITAVGGGSYGIDSIAREAWLKRRSASRKTAM